nr:hypothetical protein [Tanacetum cinerariifolium]GEX34407.1 hypothetical protein [Tanacetum cinerariifolium]
MVAFLKKPAGSEGFQEILDFLNGSHIRELVQVAVLGAKKPGGSIAQTRSETVLTSPHDSPLLRVNTLRSDKGNDKEDSEDSSKQGRMIEDIDVWNYN